MRLPCLLLSLLLASSLKAQESVTHGGRPGLRFANGVVELVVLPEGGTFASFTLANDPGPTNLVWDPARFSRDAFGPSLGHFLCVDGFGPVTAAEKAAGLPDHGEANKLPWEVVRSTSTSATFRVRLPLARETLTRTITMAPNESVILVESELESELPFDRVILWAEHATIGAPFLALGKTVVDQSATKCRTKSYDDPGPSRFPMGRDFEWPELPGYGSLRVSRATPDFYEHVGCLMDEGRDDEFITAIATEKSLLLGYLFRREDFPWVQHWMHYPEDGAYAWGLEFGMQPYDATKEELVSLSTMFGVPTFRWLPARSKMRTRFLMFATKVPPGFDRVTDVRIEGRKIVIQGAARLEIPYSGVW